MMLRPEIDEPHEHRHLTCVPEPRPPLMRQRAAAWVLDAVLAKGHLFRWLLDYLVVLAAMFLLDHAEHLSTRETVFSLFGVGWFVHLFHVHERQHRDDRN